MRRALPLLGALVALAAVGCGSGSSTGSGASTATAATATSAVSSASKDKVGRVLVDAEGRTLYRFTAERQGAIACTGDCTSTWPPALAPTGGALGDGVATIERPDGRRQLTYQGAPLYRYAGDHSTADAAGDGVGGTWFAVEAGGEDQRSSTTTAPQPQRYGY
jgi:predicted lipoprotein with Yx(FWY)xxD motif